eukprot:CCRYP_012018-RA/>CCRYP_012018-RA protein AED:0.42 eAED:0.38 QI:0/0/0/1/1/1/2/0/309
MSNKQRSSLGVSNLVLGDDEVSLDSDDEGLLEGVGFLEVEKRTTCDQNKIYLDSCATNHMTFAGEYANNIHKVAVGLRKNCNAGSSVTNKMGHWYRFKLWYSPNGIANLLSVPKLEHDGYKIDISTEIGCKVHAPDGTILHFKRDTGLCQRMPYLDMDDPQFKVDELNKEEQQSHVFIQTVCNNYEGFTRKEVDKAILACKAQGMMGSPLDDAFAAMDITNAHAIFGPSRKGLRGKTVRKKQVELSQNLCPFQRNITHTFVTLTADVMFVNGIPFFTTLSRGIQMAEHLPSRTAAQLGNSLMKVLNIYR